MVISKSHRLNHNKFSNTSFKVNVRYLRNQNFYFSITNSISSGFERLKWEKTWKIRTFMTHQLIILRSADHITSNIILKKVRFYVIFLECELWKFLEILFELSFSWHRYGLSRTSDQTRPFAQIVFSKWLPQRFCSKNSSIYEIPLNTQFLRRIAIFIELFEILSRI